MQEIVKEIQLLCMSYRDCVKDFGNECAYTDILVERIIEKASELKEKYDEEV